MVNWNSWLRRTVFAFLTLFLLAYLVPGLSAFTVTHLLMVSILSAFLATIGENVILADTSTQKSILFFCCVGPDHLFLCFCLHAGAPPGCERAVGSWARYGSGLL